MFVCHPVDGFPTHCQQHAHASTGSTQAGPLLLSSAIIKLIPSVVGAKR